jgi:hypothetical protein
MTGIETSRIIYIKTNELKGSALDWVVAKCEEPDLTLAGFTDVWERYDHAFSLNWSKGGEIIERECIDLKYLGNNHWDAHCQNANFYESGSTPLVAAMRCYVASKLGDEVEIPEEIINENQY